MFDKRMILGRPSLGVDRDTIPLNLLGQLLRTIGRSATLREQLDTSGVVNPIRVVHRFPKSHAVFAERAGRGGYRRGRVRDQMQGRRVRSSATWGHFMRFLYWRILFPFLPCGQWAGPSKKFHPVGRSLGLFGGK